MAEAAFDRNGLPCEAGSYILVLESSASRSIAIGKFARLRMQPGFYYYVGSAFGPGGLRARVGRHARRDKSRRWHIDYLRQHTRLAAIIYSTCPQPQEAHWASRLAQLEGLAMPLPGFGASDRRGQTHLFHSSPALDMDTLRPCLAPDDPAQLHVVQL